MSDLKPVALSRVISRGWAMTSLAGGLLALLAADAMAQSSSTVDAEADAKVRQRLESVIQKCIRDKTASPYICRASAYATALSEGYPPERAARLTNFRRQR